jgi:hypothetical protein
VGGVPESEFVSEADRGSVGSQGLRERASSRSLLRNAGQKVYHLILTLLAARQCNGCYPLVNLETDERCVRRPWSSMR